MITMETGVVTSEIHQDRLFLDLISENVFQDDSEASPGGTGKDQVTTLFTSSKTTPSGRTVEVKIGEKLIIFFK